MTSLVGSIFGGEKEKKESSLSTLFHSSSALPAKPQHEALPKRRKSKKQDDAATSSKKESLKRKKPRKEKRQKEADGGGDGKSKDEESATGSNEKEQQDASNDNVDNRTIFVGNLPLDSITRHSLKSLFTDCGKVESTRLRGLPTTGVKLPPQQAGNQALVKKVCANTNQIDSSVKSNIVGYVVFASASSVPKALEKNNMMLPESRNRIRVDKVDATLDPSRSVFVGNLPYGTDEESLRLHFCRHLQEPESVIENVRIIRDSTTMQCKGFGYILFQDKTLVAAALERLHETTYKKRSIRVTVCGKRFKGRGGVMTEKEESSKKKPADPVGAFKRILSKEQKGVPGDHNKRKRGDKKSGIKGPGSAKRHGSNVKKGPAGMSKRQASEAKVEKRVKKLQKRVAKGRGKTRKG